MKKIIALAAAAFLLTGCILPPHHHHHRGGGDRGYDRYDRDDGRYHCPPGQAKKGRC